MWPCGRCFNESVIDKDGLMKRRRDDVDDDDNDNYCNCDDYLEDQEADDDSYH